MQNCSNNIVGLRISDSLECPNSCSGNGACRNGRCMCSEGY